MKIRLRTLYIKHGCSRRHRHCPQYVKPSPSFRPTLTFHPNTAVALSFVIVALLTVGYRKRRMRQNMAFVQQNQGAGMDPQLQQPYYGQQNGYPSYPGYPQYSPGPGAPQYPPQTYSGAYPGYDPNAGFAPVSRSCGLTFGMVADCLRSLADGCAPSICASARASARARQGSCLNDRCDLSCTVLYAPM